MTLREILNEEIYRKRNYWVRKEKEKSVVSGKEILGFPSERSMLPYFIDRVVFDIVNVGDNTYEFYVSKDGEKTGDPYKNKEDYIGTLKIDKFKSNDDTGISLALIRKFINSKKIDQKSREYMLDWYNKHYNHPYYKGYFKAL